MRTHTTYTDVRRICKLHGEGDSVEEIMNKVHVHPSSIVKIIAVKFPGEPESDPEPVAEVAKPKAAKRKAKAKVDPIS